MQDPVLGTIEALRSPMRFHDVDLRLDPAPLLGEDTAKILQEL